MGTAIRQYGYVEQWNFDIQRQLPAGFFADVAYAGSHGVHLQQYSTNVDQLPDTLWSQACRAHARKSPIRWWARIPNPSLNGATVAAGQLERPYPQYNGLSLGGYGCCGSSYNSLQATVTRRFQGGGTTAGCVYQCKAPQQHRHSHQLARRANRWRRRRSGLEQPEGRKVALLAGRLAATGDQLRSRPSVRPWQEVRRESELGSRTVWFPDGASTALPPSNVASR